MEDGMEYIGNEEIPVQDTPDTPGDIPAEDVPDIPADPPEDPAVPDPSDPGEVGERLDDLLEQIGVSPSYGSMGDYYIADAGCYAFPTEEVFFHFVGEAERSAWTTASNGCYVPVGSLDAYEAYLSSGSQEENEGEQLPPPVTQEDLSGLEETLQAIHGEDAVFYETATLFMESTEKALEENQKLLSSIYIVATVICLFLAILCGVKVADVFWNRMRAG